MESEHEGVRGLLSATLRVAADALEFAKKRGEAALEGARKKLKGNPLLDQKGAPPLSLMFDALPADGRAILEAPAPPLPLPTQPTTN